MPLHVPSAPAPATRCVTAALSAPPAAGAPRPAFLAESGEELAVRQSLALHVLDPEPAGGGMPRARLTGWRFLLKDGDRTVTAAEATLAPEGWAFSHFCGGPYLASTERALLEAAEMSSSYQARLLSVPGLYMLCLWLHADLTDGDDAQLAAADVLIPLAPAPPGIAPHRPYRVGELLPLLTLRLTPARTPLLGTAV